MKFLPPRDSQKWFLVMIITWLINLGALVISRYQVGTVFDINMTITIASLSLLVAFVVALGYFGIDAFTKTVVFFDAVAILNMLVISTTNSSDGWSDLTSLFNYVFFIIVGIVAGILIQAAKTYFDQVEKENKKVVKPVKKVAKKTAKKKVVAKKK